MPGCRRIDSNWILTKLNSFGWEVNNSFKRLKTNRWRFLEIRWSSAYRERPRCHDWWSVDHARTCPENLPCIILTDMCNKSMQEGCLPASQKHAIISPIIKKAGMDAEDVKSYRPISNLTYMSKLIERMVYRQITTYLEANHLLPKFQSGFRARHSTETAVLKVLSDIFTATDQGSIGLLGLLDMSAAFDTVDHEILLLRLESSFGISGTVLAWLRSFLSGRTQQVVFNGGQSLLNTVTTGVPQGSVLGPLLFLLYTADIPLIAGQFGLGVHCYADDG